MADTGVKNEIEQDIHPTESHSHGSTLTIESTELHREFTPRQIAMFSVACSIGTGLVIGSGTSLVRGGPGSTLIAYILIGMCVFFVMTALGEMAAFLPMNKGFGGYATRMVDPALGFATGWNYFFKYVIAIPTNLTAAGLIIQYWRPDLSVAIWITIFGVFVIAINLFHVYMLGETEFWLGLIKVIVLTILILTTFIVAMGGGPSHHRTGFRYWNDPGAFQRYLVEGNTGIFLGWWSCMVQSSFAYIGCEVVGLTFGEVKNPRKNIPYAVKRTFWRIATFYVLGVFVLGMAVPSTDPQLVGATKSRTSAAASPFVVAIKLGGINALPDIVNAALLIFVTSAASSDIYCASRSIYGLARDRQAPHIFARTMENGIPIWAVLVSSAFAALGYLNSTKSASTVFSYFSSLVTVFAVLNWISILLSYISFRRALKAQAVTDDELPYRGILQPYGSYYALFISMIVVLFQGYDAFIPHFKVDIFILKYIGVLLYLLNILCWKFIKRTRRVKADSVDLITGRRQYEVEEQQARANAKPGVFAKIRGRFSRELPRSLTA